MSKALVQKIKDIDDYTAVFKVTGNRTETICKVEYIASGYIFDVTTYHPKYETKRIYKRVRGGAFLLNEYGNITLSVYLSNDESGLEIKSQRYSQKRFSKRDREFLQLLKE